MSLFKQQLFREILLQIRQPHLVVNTCLFFLMILVFFPLTMSPDADLLRKVAPGLVWISILLSMFLSAERMFQQDYDDGVIEQWLVSGNPISIFVGAKITIYWFVNLIPILLFCPFLAILFALDQHETWILIISLVLGTPAILAICTLAAAFSTNIKHKGLLMPLILLPLTIPIMIFGSSILTLTMQNIPSQGYLALLFAISILSLTLLPFAAAGVIRVVLVD